MSGVPNPVLPGFYPDPSWCRVGEDYWMVNSSFSVFPGLPVHHSRDLMRWTCVGHVLDRPAQLDLDGVGHSQGLFAPTIRHHRGRFYVVCTNVGKRNTFVVTADHPTGPWSDPVWLDDAPGIDPSLFFDGDKAWYCGTRPLPEGPAYFGDWEVWARELDLPTLQLTGPEHRLWRGALRDCVWPEGPHLYKKDDWYYLLIAEGGTGADHAVTVARSRSVEGPYQGCPANPVLTHRHLGPAAPVVNVGHGDLLEDHRGRWWLAHLASRPYGGVSPLGRETFLTPVAWVDGWPRPALGTGTVPSEIDTGLGGEGSPRPEVWCEPFDGPGLPPSWVGLRTPRRTFADLNRRPGWLSLSAGPESLRETGCPSFLGQRLRWRKWQALTRLSFEPSAGWAGLALVQSDTHQFRLEAGQAPGGTPVIRLVGAEGGPDDVMASVAWDGAPVVLAVRAEDHDLSFWAGPSTTRLAPVARGIDGRRLSTERAGGFVGTLAGVFAVGRDPARWAEFDWFELAPATCPA